MRLINTRIVLEEFFGEEIPMYSILSHRWTKEEVSLREWTDPLATKTKAGFHKISNACSLVRSMGFDWLWVDTNCIDKSSSAELAEAINSMFGWYQNAQLCIAHLDDVDASNAVLEAMPTSQEFLSQFRASKWFTRGWTLQELLAPSAVFFYSRNWKPLKSKADLINEIAGITGISKARPPWLRMSVAERISWLARRHTTRIEDMAYCMLGLFDINMPLMYGEGARAFVRLQEEIIRTSKDQTIFLWTELASSSAGSMRIQAMTSALASSPRAFRDAGMWQPQRRPGGPSPYFITNEGLSIRRPLLQTAGASPGPLRVCERFSDLIDDSDEQIFWRLPTFRSTLASFS
ncbi:heterokaryon incompatibility protein-domain-containing protein [Podospora didyma]|uniref:Heterokaryon incompatibility protein-domain-containing protein n=1 Tax=Podospora didyma TaxID=330526 RepID=A0AAE0K5Q6_9PEZI|nr:heterokaryon incompatibility protein-domain-containing protein [Podospora didyma]